MMRSIEDIKRAAERAGDHWFSPDTVRAFKSRVSERVYPLADLDSLQYPAGETLQAEEMTVFVSSERDDYRDRPRRYTVRLAIAGTVRRESDGREVASFDVRNLSEFGEHASLAAAHAHAQRYASGHARALTKEKE
jgi:hypothetical protein